MPTLKTITTIELSSICNLSCRYCIVRKLKRDPVRNPGIMENDVFKASLDLLRELEKRGTQEEVNLNGNGESFLDPKIIQRIEMTLAIVGPQKTMLCTNGLLLTADIARELKDVGLKRIDISVHSPLIVQPTWEMLQKEGLGGVVNTGVLMSRHNWAGQLEALYTVSKLPQVPCHPLIEGKGYIQSEGNITPCCYDYRNLGVFGSVFDDDILERRYGPYELCKTCHQTIPNEILIEHYENKHD